MSMTQTTADRPYDSFANRLMLARKQRDLLIEEAAERCGINPKTWATWENGKATPRDGMTTIDKIARGLEYERDWLAWGGPLASEPTGPGGRKAGRGRRAKVRKLPRLDSNQQPSGSRRRIPQPGYAFIAA